MVDAVFPGGGEVELEELVEGFDSFDFLSGGEQGAGIGFEEGAFAGDVVDLAEVGAFKGFHGFFGAFVVDEQARETGEALDAPGVVRGGDGERFAEVLGGAWGGE